jgi:hypothetical protein
MVQVLNIGADNAAASTFLEPYIQSGTLNFLIGSGASSPAIKTAGDIETEINALLTAGKETQANRKCLDFIDAIGGIHSKIIAGTDAMVQAVADSYGEFLSVVDAVLFARKNILLPRQANIFTTNYDMFLEHAASLLPAIILNDGFDRSSGLHSAFMFAPERYFDRTYRSGPIYGHQIEIPTINLIKVHGSLSWRKRSDTIAFDPKPVPPLSALQKVDAAQVSTFLEKHFLILPNLKKFQSTLVERVYYDLLRMFSKAMDQQNVVLMCFGFSFSDEHILDITRRALRNPTAQLIIFSHDEASSTVYQERFAKQRNVTVIAPDASSVIDFGRLNKILSSILRGQAHAVA